MLQIKKKKEHLLFKLTNRQNGQETVFILKQSKSIIGRAPNADFSLPSDQFLSWYHALLIIDNNEQARLIDLASENGVYINGKLVKDGYFSDGDILRFGNLEFHVSEYIDTSAFENKDKDAIKLIDREVIESHTKAYNPASLKGLTLIEGEYCDIHFKENHQVYHELPLEKLNFTEHVNFEDETAEKVDTIIKPSKGKSIEIIIMSMGHVLTVEYFDLKNKTYYISGKEQSRSTLLLEVLDHEEIGPSDKIKKKIKKWPFIKIEKNSIQIYKIEGLKGYNLSTEEMDLFKETQVISFNQEHTLSYAGLGVQLFLRVVDTPSKLKKLPPLSFDKQFIKDFSPLFLALFSLMFVFLMIDIPTQLPPEKKIAVIYKAEPKQIVEKSPPKNSEVTENPTASTENIPVQKVEKAAAPQKPKVQEKTVVSGPSAPSSTYEFKSSAASSLFSNTASSVTIEKGAAPGVTTTTNIGSSGISGTLKTTGGGSAATGLGSDSSGTGKRSTGAHGLVSKNGTDTTYVDPRTVVLGSIDPELLRKILQEYIPQFRHCYQQELEMNEGIQGVVDLNFRIDKTGKVSKVDIKARAEFSAQGKGCMANVLKLIEFPTPKGGGHVDVRQPLNFFSEQSKI